MKKLTAYVLVAVLVLSMAACGSETKDTLAGTMEENVQKLVELAPVEFMGGLIPVDLSDTSEEGLWRLGNYTGLDSADLLSDIAVYEPMTGSQAFSLVMVRVAQGSDAKAVAQQMNDGINPAKWICVCADEKIVAGYGDVVMLIMLDSQLGLSAQSYVDAFAQVAGGELDFTI